MLKGTRGRKRMKIRIEVIPEIEETMVIIQCKELDDTIGQIQKTISDTTTRKQSFIFFKEEREYFFPLDEIIFFETADNQIHAHTGTDVFQVKYRLYELEEILPGNFVRVSKSTILNSDRIHSITKNLASANTVAFIGTHKQVFVSRYYYRALKDKLESRRFRI